jgi:hypothetical protein
MLQFFFVIGPSLLRQDFEPAALLLPLGKFMVLVTQQMQHTAPHWAWCAACAMVATRIQHNRHTASPVCAVD